MRIRREYQIEQATAGKDNSRPLFTHVLIERLSDVTNGFGFQEGRATAADGYILATVPVDLEPDDVVGLVAGHLFTQARKAKSNIDPTILLREGTARLPFVEGSPEPSRYTDNIDATCTFPKYGTIITQAASAKPMEVTAFSLDPSKLARLAKALGCEFVRIQVNNANNAVLVGPNVPLVSEDRPEFGLIMPVSLTAQGGSVHPGVRVGETVPA